jgi:predicted Zn-dependent protease
MKKTTAIAIFAMLAASAGLGVTQTRSISAADKAEGAKSHPQLLEEYGGLYTGPQAAYVTRVGRRIAVQSGLSNSQSDFTISLLNSSLNNAFAIPGGYVYVTRQLMALMNDEAELAGVLGHEVGHVAARHSRKRQKAATRNSIFGALGQVLVGAVTGNSQIGQLLGQGIGTGTQLLTLRFSRAQETEADNLGVRYLMGAGYDPYALGSMLASLQAQNDLDARAKGAQSGTVPSWASTHPDPGARVLNVRTQAQRAGAADGRGERNREAFLTSLNGVIYDDDPAQGTIDGQRFLHRDLRFAFTAPQGFSIQNGTSAVTVAGSGGQAQFSAGAVGQGGLSGYIDTVFRGIGAQGGVGQAGVRPVTINGFEAAIASTRAQTQGGSVDVNVVAYSAGAGRGYHFVTITPAGQGLGPFSNMVQSFSRLSDAEARAIRPRRIQVVTATASDSVDTLARRMAVSSLQRERFMVLNGLAGGERIAPGQKVKLVVYG